MNHYLDALLGAIIEGAKNSIAYDMAGRGLPDADFLAIARVVLAEELEGDPSMAHDALSFMWVLAIGDVDGARKVAERMCGAEEQGE